MSLDDIFPEVEQKIMKKFRSHSYNHQQIDEVVARDKEDKYEMNFLDYIISDNRYFKFGKMGKMSQTSDIKNVKVKKILEDMRSEDD